MLRKTKVYQKANLNDFGPAGFLTNILLRNCERPNARWQPTVPGIGYLYVCPNTYYNCTMASCILYHIMI